MLWKGVDFEFVRTIPGRKGDGGTRAKEYLEKNPLATVPFIETGDGFRLGESHASECSSRG